jgi:hypothetical protein
MASTFKHLLEKYLADQISASEKALLFKMLASRDYEATLEQIIDDDFLKGEITGLADKDRAQVVFNRIMEAGQLPVRPYISRRLRYAVAAAAIVFFAVVTYKFRKTNHPSYKLADTEKIDQDIIPGSNKAMLTMADGSIIILDGTGTRTIQQGTVDIQQDKGQLQYAQQQTEINISYNTLTTPRGGQFRLILPDGSGIWLNAASSVTYPTTFTGNKRCVTVTGEVYLEIAHNANMPFEVSVNGMQITVLGTHFNINAYGDEPSVNTTLLQGAVKVTSNNESHLLQPAQQLQRWPDGTLSIIKNIDTAAVVAWKNGMFSFNDADIPSIMRQVNRWYDAEIVYKDTVSHHFMGSIPRAVPVSKLLKILELTGQLHFKIEGRKIIVTQ